LKPDKVIKSKLSQDEHNFFFCCGGRGSKLKPYIYYALFLLTKLSSRGHKMSIATQTIAYSKECKRKTLWILCLYSKVFKNYQDNNLNLRLVT